jgi:hypothetical protein
MDPNRLNGRGGALGVMDGWASDLETAAHRLMGVVVVLGIFALVCVWGFISWPDNPYATAMKTWVQHYTTNLVGNALWMVFVAGILTAIVAAFRFHSSHHEHGKKMLTGALAGSAIVLGVALSLHLWPSLLTQGIG